MDEGRSRRHSYRAWTSEAGPMLHVVHNRDNRDNQPTSQSFLARHETISTPAENDMSFNRLPRATLVAKYSPCLSSEKLDLTGDNDRYRKALLLQRMTHQGPKSGWTGKTPNQTKLSSYLTARPQESDKSLPSSASPPRSWYSMRARLAPNVEWYAVLQQEPFKILLSRGL